MKKSNLLVRLLSLALVIIMMIGLAIVPVSAVGGRGPRHDASQGTVIDTGNSDNDGNVGGENDDEDIDDNENDDEDIDNSGNNDEDIDNSGNNDEDIDNSGNNDEDIDNSGNDDEDIDNSGNKNNNSNSNEIVLLDTNLLKASYYQLNVTLGTTTNCTIYYSINGGELTELTEAGVRQEDFKGSVIAYFAVPDDGYLLTELGQTNSANNYYPMSTVTQDKGTWRATNLKDESGNLPVPKNMTQDAWTGVIESALALGAQGMCWNSRSEKDSTIINGQMNATAKTTKLSVTKALTSVERDGEALSLIPNLLHVGDVLTYTITVSAPDSKDVKLQSYTIADQFSVENGGTLTDSDGKEVTGQSTFQKSDNTFYYTYTVRSSDVGATLTNTASVSATYTTQYGSATYNTSASSQAVEATVISGVSYVVTGAPEGASLPELPDAVTYALGASVSVDTDVLTSLNDDSSAWTIAGYTFSGWSVTPDVTITDGVFTMPGENVVFSASYTPIEYTVTVTVDEPSRATTTGAGTYHYGDSVTVTATANEGYMVTGMTDNGADVTGSTYTFTVYKDHAIVVTTAEDMAQLTITATIDDANFANGDPIFVYNVTVGSYSVPAVIRITEGRTGSTTVTVPYGDYTVTTQSAALRYNETGSSNATGTLSATDRIAQADFTYARFEEKYFSGTDVKVNTITLADKYVGGNGGSTDPVDPPVDPEEPVEPEVPETYTVTLNVADKYGDFLPVSYNASPLTDMGFTRNGNTYTIEVEAGEKLSLPAISGTPKLIWYTVSVSLSYNSNNITVDSDITISGTWKR